LVMLTAFGFDMGAFYVDHRMAQSQADAAALAAVNTLPGPSSSSGTAAAALAAAEDSATWNRVSDVAQLGCGTDGPDTIRVSAMGPFDALNPADQSNTARVCVRRPSRAVFAQLAQIKSVMVSAAAQAVVRYVPLQYSLMAMDPGCTGGNANLTITGGAQVTLGGGGDTYTAATNCNPALKV